MAAESKPYLSAGPTCLH